MKKIILLLLICFCFLASGCSYGGAGLVQNSNGTVVEYYYVPFPESELTANGVLKSQLDEIGLRVKAAYEGDIISRINEYKQRVASSTAYTQEEKEFLLTGVDYALEYINDSNGIRKSIQVRYNFINSTCYAEFKNANEDIKEDRVVETINNFFTTTTKVIKDPLFDKLATESITLGKYYLQQVNLQMINVLGIVQWEQIKQQLNYDKYASAFEYTYIVPTARVHSNADAIRQDGDGYYYHTWKVDLNNLDENGESIIKIQYWTVSANKWVWYVLTLLIAGGIIAGVYFAGKKIEQKKSEQFEVEQNNE